MERGIGIRYPMGWRGRVIYGGPYHEYPGNGVIGIKMAKEINAPCHISIPTVDFGVPKVQDMQEGIKQALEVMAQGKPIYVGCMGGIGRTGLFMACLAKVLGIDQPVAWVRKNYMKHAVETTKQGQYVKDFDIVPLQSIARKAKLKAKMYFWK